MGYNTCAIEDSVMAVCVISVKFIKCLRTSTEERSDGTNLPGGPTHNRGLQEGWLVITILSQLKSFRFVLVKPHEKEAFETGLPSYTRDDPKLLEHLRTGNYGVLAGHEYALIDTDDPELEREIRAKLPATFEVSSPGHDGTHFYYRCKTPESSRTITVLDKTRPKDQWNIGHVRIGNGYLVGPGSTHPNGKLYLVKQARAFAEVTEQQIRETLTPWQAEKAARLEREYVNSQGYGDLTFPITAILDLSRFKKSGGTYIGPHPVHGSTTGVNFHVDTRKNRYYCFRCCVGGGPLQALAVIERVRDCDEVNPLRDEDFKKTVSLAIERGLVKSPSERVEGPEYQASEDDLAWLRTPLSFAKVADILGITVKRDSANKKVLFAAMLLTYTDEEQINVLMAAESSAGKSYLPIEISQYFPERDVIILGGASPTSFFHEISGGEFAIWDPEKKQSIVNLANKILIFLDQPHVLLLERLRPFLSHDQKRIKYKVSDRSQKSGLRTKTIILVGFSSVFFCTASFTLDQQERTRNWQLSPETDVEKVKDALTLLLDKKSNRQAFRDKLASDPERQALMKRVLDVKNSGVHDVEIPQELKNRIHNDWEAKHPNPIPRHIRDMDRFLSLVKARALLNWRLRQSAGSGRILAEAEDLEEASTLYAEISEANELGLAPQVFEIFRQVIQPIGTASPNIIVGVTKRDILREYFRLYHRPLPLKRLEKEVLPPLDASGLIAEEPDPDQKNRNLIYPQVAGSNARGKVTPPKVGVDKQDPDYQRLKNLSLTGR
jgi:hypothetical protein